MPRDQTRTNHYVAKVWRERVWCVAQSLEVDGASQGKSEQEALENLALACE